MVSNKSKISGNFMKIIFQRIDLFARVIFFLLKKKYFGGKTLLVLFQVKRYCVAGVEVINSDN